MTAVRGRSTPSSGGAQRGIGRSGERREIRTAGVQQLAPLRSPGFRRQRAERIQGFERNAGVVVACALAQRGQVLERVRPWLSAIGPTITHVGPLGLAVTMKIAVMISGNERIASMKRPTTSSTTPRR